MNSTDSKSHTAEEIRSAISEGKTLYLLDSDCSGNDDIMIAEPGESEDDITATVEGWAKSCGYCEDGSELWEGQGAWSLRAMDPSELDDLDA